MVKGEPLSPLVLNFVFLGVTETNPFGVDGNNCCGSSSMHSRSGDVRLERVDLWVAEREEFMVTRDDVGGEAGDAEFSLKIRGEHTRLATFRDGDEDGDNDDDEDDEDNEDDDDDGVGVEAGAESERTGAEFAERVFSSNSFSCLLRSLLRLLLIASFINATAENPSFGICCSCCCCLL